MRLRTGGVVAAWLLAIGTVAGLAQRGFAQAPELQVGGLPADDSRLRERFTELLLAAPTRDVREGLQLARALGTPAAPVLWALVAGEKSNMKRRMAVLAAACLAEGPSGDDRVLAFLDEKSALQDRLVCSLCLALGPMRSRPQPEFWARVIGRNRQEPEPLILVAALLASSRFPGAGEACPPALLRQENPGITAAAVYAGAPVPAVLVQPYLRSRPPAHADLVQRALLLHERLRSHDVPVPATSVDRARELVTAPSEQNATLRDAAALLLASADAVAVEGQPRPEWRLLQLYASELRAASSLRAWLPAAPQPLDEPAWARLAVAYALSRSPEAVVADRTVWGAVPAVRRHIAVALAWRLCAEASPTPIRSTLSDVPEWAFVRWASGVDVPPGATIDDSPLQQAFVLMVDGRLPREAASVAFEDALWRWQSHPGLGVHGAQRDLLRDLMLSGSLPGNRYQIGLPDHLRYLPAGLGNENDFFGLAVDVWEFTRSPSLPIPAECRLR